MTRINQRGELNPYRNAGVYGADSSPPEQAQEPRPVKYDLRMDAYYYGFQSTGVLMVDRILSAVAEAGKAYHHTEDWRTETRAGEGSPQDWIQQAANDAAKLYAATPIQTEITSGPSMQLIGEMRDGIVVWFDQNPHAHPIGTKFYAAPARPDEQEKPYGGFADFIREAKEKNLTIHNILPQLVKRCAELEDEQQAPAITEQAPAGEVLAQKARDFAMSLRFDRDCLKCNAVFADCETKAAADLLDKLAAALSTPPAVPPEQKAAQPVTAKQKGAIK